MDHLSAHLIPLGRLAALLFIALGGYVAVMNWLTFIATRRTGRFHSAVPLFGAVLLGAGLALLPRTRHYAWTAILIDYGTVILLFSLPQIAREAWESSRYNLLAGYQGGRGILSVRVSLYRHGICIIKHDLKRAAGELGMVSMSRVGTWSQDGQCLTLHVGEASAQFAVDGEDEVLRQVSGFSGDTDELSLAGIELRRQGARR